MGRENKNIYCFIQDENKRFCRATQLPDGSYNITRNAQPYPITHTPSNLINSELEFATNRKYNSMVRSISFPLDFFMDGAAILREMYYKGKASQQICYFTVIEWNGVTNMYELSYRGKFDMLKKTEDPKAGRFTIPTVDDSAWGVLSMSDDIDFAIDCSPTNPKAIPVLFDGMNLENKYTFQTVQAPIIRSVGTGTDNAFLIPFVLINENGDSAGVMTKSQGSYHTSNIVGEVAELPGWFLNTFYALPNVHIFGDFTFTWGNDTGHSEGIIIYFYTSTKQMITVFSAPAPNELEPGKTYTFPIDFTINLAVDESMFFIININSNSANNMRIIPTVTNIFVHTITRQEPVVRYGLRAIDLLKELVAKATDNRYTITSSFFVENNKDILFGGDSIRGEANAHIYTSFNDFFKHFNVLYYMALRSVNGQLEMEPYTEVYKNSGNIIDLGDLIDFKASVAETEIFSEINAGCRDQDFRHASGRLEFNSENKFSLKLWNVKNKLDLVSPYRFGCFDIQFLIMDYVAGNTKDNSGDKSVYCVRITDELGTDTFDVETFEEVTIDNAILEPIIKSPLTNSTVTFNKPFIKGIAPALSPVNIYIDGALDGGTLADANGNWGYQVVTALSEYIDGIQSGEHLVEATYTDLADPSNAITLLVDTSFVRETNIIYPETGVDLYNNLPLIRGVAQHGTNVDVIINGAVIATVPVDNSDIWEYKVVVPLPNTANTIQVGPDISNINVNSFVPHPLITYIGSEIDGFIVIDNTPLIQGVAMPGTVVTLYLDYNIHPMGNAVANATGNWSFQVIPVTYTDEFGNSVILTPIPNGLHIISTSLVNFTVPVGVSGYKLSRPDYSSISGVLDNTVFNTEYTPKRILFAHKPTFAAILKNQRNEFVYFQKPSKNGFLSTTLDGVTIRENANEPASSFGEPMALLDIADVKTKTYKSFAKTLEDFNNGGLIKATFRGTDLFFLPIGSMRMNNITSESQEWRLQLSSVTTYTQLLNLYKNGTTINIMKNSIYHSNYNSLHTVAYDFQVNPLFSFKSVYEDWFSNRNDAWFLNPEYVQKFKRIDPIRDQIVANGVSGMTFDLYRARDARRIASIPYLPITPAPIAGPEVAYEALIDLTAYPEDQYFAVIAIGEFKVSIFERFETRDNWEKTILIQASNSVNKPGMFFSTGIESVIRVEGIVKKLQPMFTSDIAREESGDTEILYSLVSRKNVIRFGTAYGLPDFLYLKIADDLGLDDFKCEGIKYTVADGEGITPSDDVNGHPLYYYNVNMTPAKNQTGATVPGADVDANVNGVILIVDAEAVGLPSGSVITIAVDNE